MCDWKKITRVEAEICPDHVHILLEIPPKVAVSSFMGFLKGKNSLMIYEKYPELKYKYRNREFWCKGYYVDTVGKNAKKIEEYLLSVVLNTAIVFCAHKSRSFASSFVKEDANLVRFTNTASGIPHTPLHYLAL